MHMPTSAESTSCHILRSHWIRIFMILGNIYLIYLYAYFTFMVTKYCFHRNVQIIHVGNIQSQLALYQTRILFTISLCQSSPLLPPSCTHTHPSTNTGEIHQKKNKQLTLPTPQVCTYEKRNVAMKWYRWIKCDGNRTNFMVYWDFFQFRYLAFSFSNY